MIDSGAREVRQSEPQQSDQCEGINVVQNADSQTITSFGAEWQRYDQSSLPWDERERMFEGYFGIFPWECLPKDAEGFDMGCGSGRWAAMVAPRVGVLHCIDPSSVALSVARRALAGNQNAKFHLASVDDVDLSPNSQDFGYALGVLHHVPDTGKAIAQSVLLLKPGAPLLVYLYYAFDNRPSWFRMIWRCTELLRHRISRMDDRHKPLVTDLIAYLIYWPIARLNWFLSRIGIATPDIPLHSYRDASIYTMRTDSRDRFGTPLEQRFSRDEIAKMMHAAGLENVRFSEDAPYWCAVGIKAV